VQRPSDREAADELVVDARCFVEVLEALRDRQVFPSTADLTTSSELDLVLVRGLELGVYAERAERVLLAEVAASTGVSEPTGLDYLLYDLRRDLGERTGRVPVLGKNRDAVVGYPQHKALKFPSPPQGGFVVPEGAAGEGLTVGIVDTAPVRHPLLPPALVDSDTWFTPEGAVAPWAGHGTFVAGLVRHEAPAARLRMRAGLSPEQGGASCWDIARAMATFRGSEVAVLNLSFGCVTADQAPPLLLERALDRLGSEVLVVCAAGNRGRDRGDHPPEYLWPGATTTAVAVGAVEAGDDLVSLQRPWVDVLAPGVRVTSTFLDDVQVTMADPADPDTAPTTEQFHGFATWSGTSFAAATLTGKVAARMTKDGVSARDALQRLLDDPVSGVTAYSGSRPGA
jgi:hypothetical protein